MNHSLSALIDCLKGLVLRFEQKDFNNNFQFQHITVESKKANSTTIFLAKVGLTTHGLIYAESAIQQGCLCILYPERDRLMLELKGSLRLPLHKGVVYIGVSDIYEAEQRLKWFFYPTQSTWLGAVTGTNGKTSIADYVRQLWHQEGLVSGSIGTLGVKLNQDQSLYYNDNTTPSSVDMFRFMSLLNEHHSKHIVVEASSHGLAMERLEGFRFDSGCFTNLTLDHLDFHKTMESYLQAKLRLLDYLKPTATMVVNMDDSYGIYFARQAYRMGLKVYGFTRQANASQESTHALLVVRSIEPNPKGLRVDFTYQSNNFSVVLPVFIEYQVVNVLLSLLMLSESIPMQHLLHHTQSLVSPSGRFEYIGEIKGGKIFVDFAHTPDALYNVLNASRQSTKGRLICVFGCGGNRDATKRPIMGKIAQEQADLVYVTDDNPRFEDPKAIRKQILEGAPKAIEIGDRVLAIQHAIRQLGQDDKLIVCGKGHEEGQIIKDEVIPHNDKTVILQCLHQLQKSL